MRAAARITFLTALASVGFMATPSQAQQVWGWGYYGGFGYRPPIVDRPARYYLQQPMPAGEIMEILREEGYRPLGRPVLSGDAYVAQAENGRGQRLQVIVHAYDGDILERRVVGRGAPDRPTVRRPATREEAGLPPRSVAPSPPRDGEAVAPPLPVERAPLARPATPDEQAAAPLSPPPELNPTMPRGNQTVTQPKPATPPAAARPRPPNQASAPPKVQQPANPALSPNPGGPAPTLESTESPKEQQARQQPRVILPNPADSSSNSSLPPVTPLETQPATPVPPTPPVAPAPLN